MIIILESYYYAMKEHENYVTKQILKHNSSTGLCTLKSKVWILKIPAKYVRKVINKKYVVLRKK